MLALNTAVGFQMIRDVDKRLAKETSKLWQNQSN